MKKSIIILIMVVFLGSVFVVGVFGMQNVPYNERIYVQEIIPTSVTLSTNEKVEIKQNERGYYIRFTYEEGAIVFINYIITPDNASNRHVDITIDNTNDNSNAELLPNRGIKFNDSGSIVVTFSSVDSGEPKTMKFYIYTKKAATTPTE